MIVARLIQSIIPDLPSGLGDISLLIQIVIILISMSVGWKISLISTSIYVFAIVWMWPSQFIGGILWVTGWENVMGVYLLDYVIPLLLLSMLGIFIKMNYKFLFILLFLFMNYSSHVVSGWVFFSSYSWNGIGPWIYSMLANLIQISVMTFMTLIITRLSQSLSKGILVQNGYVNDSIKVKIDGKWYQKRIPKYDIAEWDNEKKVYEKLNINIKYLDSGTFLKEWQKGRTIKYWNNKKLVGLKETIESFHQIDAKNISKHDWFKHKEHFEKIEKKLWDEFNTLVKSFDKHNMVLSHNDINGRNILYWKGKITLIDFEWTRLNSEYYDYAQFYVAENKFILPNHMDKKIHNNMVRAIIIFNYLWTYSMPESNKVLKLRNKYKELL